MMIKDDLEMAGVGRGDDRRVEGARVARFEGGTLPN